MPRHSRWRAGAGGAARAVVTRCGCGRGGQTSSSNRRRLPVRRAAGTTATGIDASAAASCWSNGTGAAAPPAAAAGRSPAGAAAGEAAGGGSGCSHSSPDWEAEEGAGPAAEWVGEAEHEGPAPSVPAAPGGLSHPPSMQPLAPQPQAAPAQGLLLQLASLPVLGMLASWQSSSCQPKEGVLSGHTNRTGILGRCGAAPQPRAASAHRAGGWAGERAAQRCMQSALGSACAGPMQERPCASAPGKGAAGQRRLPLPRAGRAGPCTTSAAPPLTQVGAGAAALLLVPAAGRAAGRRCPPVLDAAAPPKGQHQAGQRGQAQQHAWRAGRQPGGQGGSGCGCAAAARRGTAARRPRSAGAAAGWRQGRCRQLLPGLPNTGRMQALQRPRNLGTHPRE